MSRLYKLKNPKLTSSFTLCALASAILCALPFTFPQLYFTAWLGMAPFFYLLMSEKFMTLGKLSAFRVGFLWGFFYCVLIYYWFVRLYPLDFAGLSPAAAVFVIIAAWFGISAFQALFFGLGTLAFRVIGRPRPLLLALIFTLCEFFWQFGELAFPWCKMAVTQYRCLPFIQSAALGGSTLVSFVIYAVSALFAAQKRGKRYIFAAAALFAVNMLYGAILLNIPTSYSNSASFSLIQGNITSDSKWHTSARELFDTFQDISLESAEQCAPDYIVWPESAVPVALNSAYKDDFLQIPQSADAAFIVGAFGKIDGKTSNSVYLIDKNGVNDAFYSKRHLVPFGEYLPYRGFFEKALPFVADINMLSDDLARGADSAVFSASHGKIGALVCFDSIFAELARDSASDGAELLVLVTNDSWYYDSAATSQHAAQAVFRAVENRRCVARCANTGISMLIDEKGAIKKSLPALQKGFICGELGFTDRATPYTALGDLWLYVGTIYVITIIIIKIIQARRLKKWKLKNSTSEMTTPR